MLRVKPTSMRRNADLLLLSRYAHAAAKEAASGALRAHKPILSRLPNGVLVASWENYSPVSRITVAARGGPRYESSELVGASHLLRRAIGIVGTKQYTAFGLTRSMQQMGASLTTSSTREHLLVSADVIRDFAADAVERLANAATRIQFERHWEVEEALKYVEADQVQLEQNLEARLLEALHDAAYRSGLRRSLFAPVYRTHENLEAHEFIEAFHSRVFGAASNVAVIGQGVAHEDAEAFAAKLQLGGGRAAGAHGHGHGHGHGHEQKQKTAGADSAAVKKEASKFGGGERRVDTGDELAHAAIACESAGYTDLRGSLAFSVLAKAIGATSTVQRASNTATNRLGAAVEKAGLREAHHVGALNVQHSDSGLFGFHVVASADEIGKAIRAGRAEFLQALKGGVSIEDVKRAKAQLQAEIALGGDASNDWTERCAASVLETGKLAPTIEELSAEIERLSVEDINGAARRALSGKPAYAVVGGIEHAPTLDDL